MIGSAEWIAEREQIYGERTKRIEDVCKSIPHKHKRRNQGSSFWFDLTYNLAICMHSKVWKELTTVNGFEIWSQSLGWVNNMEKLHGSPLRCAIKT